MIENSKTFTEKNTSKKARTLSLSNISAEALDARKKKLKYRRKEL